MALYAAAAPATPELVGSGIDFSKRKATVSELRVAGYELLVLGRDDRDCKWLSSWLRGLAFSVGDSISEPEDVLSILSKLTLNVHWHQSGHELNPRSKNGQRIRIGVVT
jgi:hypothetical protein